jgi:glycosyltransferase involved in cell wall biosynthesis
MKVLLVTYWFPPANTMAAIRMGKLAKFLHETGHDVRVLAARSPEDPSLPVEVPEDRIIRTPYWDVDRIFDPVVNALRRLVWRLPRPRTTKGKSALPETTPSVARPPVVTGLRRHYYAMIQVPDSHVGWLGYAVRAGRELFKSWRPEIVVASAPPFTCLVIARRLAHALGIPWVAEFRDIWVDNPYNTDPLWRQRIDRVIERRMLKSASGIVTVTPIWSGVLEQQYGLPVATILNGYAEEDLVTPPPPERSTTVSIVYTGAIYPGYRDPSPLFAAIALLGDKRDCVEVVFYGPAAGDVIPLAERHGVADRVVIRPRVSYRQSLTIQAAADVLLLLQWNNVKDEGNIPGKFFEYIGARRPILLHGYENGIMARMIRERGLGVVSNDPSGLVEHLRRWIAERPEGIPAIPVSGGQGLSRPDQYRDYAAYLAGLIKSRGRSRGAAKAVSHDREKAAATASRK